MRARQSGGGSGGMEFFNYAMVLASVIVGLANLPLLAFLNFRMMQASS